MKRERKGREKERRKGGLRAKQGVNKEEMRRSKWKRVRIRG